MSDKETDEKRENYVAEATDTYNKLIYAVKMYNNTRETYIKRLEALFDKVRNPNIQTDVNEVESVKFFDNYYLQLLNMDGRLKIRLMLGGVEKYFDELTPSDLVGVLQNIHIALNDLAEQVNAITARLADASEFIRLFVDEFSPKL